MNRRGPQWQTKPPLGVSINSEAILAQGLVGCWLFNEAGGLQVRDIAGGSVATISSAGVWTPTQYGIGLKYTANGFANLGAAKMSAGLNTSRSTIAIWFYWNGTTNTSQNILERNDGNNGWYMQLTGSNVFSFGVNYASGDLLTTTTGAGNAATVGPLIMWAVTGDGSSTAANYKNYVNGKLLTQSNQNGSGGEGSDSAIAITVAGFSGGAAETNMTAVQVMMWSRQLAQNDIEELYVNPWTIFRYRRPFGFVSAVTNKLFLPSTLSGLGSGGPFFHNPLG